MSRAKAAYEKLKAWLKKTRLLLVIEERYGKYKASTKVFFKDLKEELYKNTVKAVAKIIGLLLVAALSFLGLDKFFESWTAPPLEKRVVSGKVYHSENDSLVQGVLVTVVERGDTMRTLKDGVFKFVLFLEEDVNDVELSFECKGFNDKQKCVNVPKTVNPLEQEDESITLEPANNNIE